MLSWGRSLESVINKLKSQKSVGGKMLKLKVQKT